MAKRERIDCGKRDSLGKNLFGLDFFRRVFWDKMMVSYHERIKIPLDFMP